MDVGEMNRSDCGSTSGLHMPASVWLTDTHSLFPVALPFSHALVLSISVSVHIAASPLPPSARGQMINIIESETQTGAVTDRAPALSEPARMAKKPRRKHEDGRDSEKLQAARGHFAFLVANSLAIAVKKPETALISSLTEVRGHLFHSSFCLHQRNNTFVCPLVFSHTLFHVSQG